MVDKTIQANNIIDMMHLNILITSIKASKGGQELVTKLIEGWSVLFDDWVCLRFCLLLSRTVSCLLNVTHSFIHKVKTFPAVQISQGREQIILFAQIKEIFLLQFNAF